jgi:hypothetical protein
MPESYLVSSAGPKQPTNNWLSWLSKEYKKIKDNDTSIAGLLGINCSSNVQTIYKPVPIEDNEGKNVAIIGSNSQWKSNHGFSYIDANNLVSIYLIEKLQNIPIKICPLEPFPKTYLHQKLGQNLTTMACASFQSQPQFSLVKNQSKDLFLMTTFLIKWKSSPRNMVNGPI